ncbi:hypothetical protein CYFUS_009417 [Cystobacter fuscus]|uniref:EcsC family protein n=1 Tax=Cystobacter fuscus TaxID=43 RepID=A0A250JLD1_9BACT|nr:EcsC family protein [Cystobacter fuscus]ATB43936.1 hypothetical protein CYFUS_009417 [Cystobacter fuscus]
MAFYDPIADKVKKLTPAELKKLADTKLTDLVQQEIPRARKRVLELEQRYPSAGVRERAQRLIDEKKHVASMTGGIFGVFGLVGLPMDLTVMAWLQLTLLVDVATLYKVNIKGTHALNELLELYGYTTGVGTVRRSGPRVLGSVAEVLLKKGGMQTLGKAMPLVAVPVTAYLNHKHIQMVGDNAVRFYEGFHKAHAKTRAASHK